MKSKKRISITVRLIAMAFIPALVLGTFLSVTSKHAIEDSLRNEVMRNLNSVAESCLYMAENYSGLMDESSLAIFQEYCDFVKDSTSVDLTFFAGDTRYATSIKDNKGNPITGTKAAEDVINTVIKGSNDYSTSDIVINEEDFFGYYIPIKDSSSNVVGMVFAGQPVSYVNEILDATTSPLTRISTIIFLIVIISSTLISHHLGRIISSSVKYVTTLSDGNLKFEINEKVCKRNDELGDLNKNILKLKNTLNNLVNDIMQYSTALDTGSDALNSMSEAYSQAAGQIASTIDELGRSVVNLSEEVQGCSHETDLIGTDIEDITNNISELRNAIQNTQSTSNSARDTVISLSNANNTSIEAVKNIVAQVNATNKAVSDITGITAALNDITSQVNLLSLNASIEAARAGDAGRGFAVVADEIRKLADQSASSTGDIINIITNLTNESERTIQLANEVSEAILLEHESLIKTGESFDIIQKNIHTIGSSVETVNAKTAQLDKSKTSVIDSMTNLSAISEENAASAEEVTAGCQEMSANSSLLHAKSEEIKDMALKLNDKLTYFEV